MKSFDQLFPTLNKINATGVIRAKPEDFIVIENTDIKFTEKGEHLWLRIEKINCNTAWVATQIASACKVPARQVGFAGQKDRHAVTQQWFSVQLPKIVEIELIQQALPDEISIIEHHWHQSKLKTGFLDSNQFKIRIRNIEGCCENITKNIKKVSEHGVPNYFGPQRFGHGMANIYKAQDWFEDRIRVRNKNLRGLLISTARSYIFNLILAKRIQEDTWDKVINGDVFQLDGSHSWFPQSAATSDEIQERLKGFDIHLTAALWGEDEVKSSDACATLEQSIANQFPSFLKGFQKYRVKQDRRSLRLMPQNITSKWIEGDLILKFMLPPGAYATGVIREIINYSDAQLKQSD